MSVWIDFEELKSRVTMEMILDHYGVTLRRKNNELSGRCPLPDTSNGPVPFRALRRTADRLECVVNPTFM